MPLNFSTSPLVLGIIRDLELSKIKDSNHNYRNFQITELVDLASSISQKGLLQPIIVRPFGDHYKIVAGHRRYHACKKLGWRKIICHVVEIDDKEAFEISLIENVQRNTLDPLEEAGAFKTYVIEFGWGGITDLAKKIGKSVSYVDKRIRLLSLPEDILKSAPNYSLRSSALEELLVLNDTHQQSDLAILASRERLPVKSIRKIVKGIKRGEALSLYSDSVIKGSTNTNISKENKRLFDKSIVTLKVAMNTMSDIMEGIEDNWIVYGILKHHRDILHTEIDSLMREKKRSSKFFDVDKDN